MFEWLGEALYAVWSWGWMLSTILLLTVLVPLAIIASEGTNSKSLLNPVNVFLAGIIILLVTIGIVSYHHLTGYYAVKDLRTQFDAAIVSTDSTGVQKLNVNIEDLVKERDLRLGKLGLCKSGGWYVSKDTGEPPQPDTGSIAYYYCGRYR